MKAFIDENGREYKMLIPTIIMGVLAVTLFVISCYKGSDAHVLGLKSAGLMMIKVLPMLFFAFVVASIVQILIPEDVLSKWIGVESRIRGLIMATIAGALCPGGPFVIFPLSAGLLKTGASIGIVVAFTTAWAMLSLSRLLLEVGILGWKFTLIRVGSVFFFPPIAGLLAQMLVALRK